MIDVRASPVTGANRRGVHQDHHVDVDRAGPELPVEHENVEVSNVRLLLNYKF